VWNRPGRKVGAFSFYAQVLKSVNADFCIDILFTIAVHKNIYTMKAYTKNGFKFFYDKHQKLWVLYPVDHLGNRIEWDENDKPIEADYFNNKTELNAFLNSNKH